LISSSLFISGYLGWTFTLFALGTLVYFNLKTITLSLAQLSLSFQIFYAKYSWWLFAAALLPALTAFLFATVLDVTAMTSELIALSMLLITILLYTWIVFMPHHDERFGDIENLKGEVWRSSRYRLIKNIFGIAILSSGTGFMLKFLRISGADELLILGLTTLGIISYAVGYYLSRPKWLGIVCGLVLGNSAMGFLFKLLHLPGADEMMMMALAFQIMFYIMYLVKRERFHRIFFRVVLIFSIAMLVFLDFGGTGLLSRVVLMYSHRTLNVSTLSEFYAAVPSSGLTTNSEKLAEQIVACERYLDAYPTQNMTRIHRRWGHYFYEVVITNLYDNQKISTDAGSLARVDEAFSQLVKLQREFGYEGIDDPFLEVDILLAHGKIDDAVRNLNIMLIDAIKPRKEAIEEKLQSIKLIPTSPE
jgi:hypothetical protein